MMYFPQMRCPGPVTLAVVTIGAFCVITFMHSFLLLAEYDAKRNVSTPYGDATKLEKSSRRNQGYPVPMVSLEDVPLWIQNYIQWHNEMRQKFPGDLLLTDPRAPGLLIRTCSASVPCGGLHDRLGKLPWDLYLANQTERVLLLHWCKPAPLQEYLLPNVIDWSFPTLDGTVDPVYQNINTCSGTVNHMKDLFEGFASTRPRPSFWKNELHQSLARAKSDRAFATARLLKSNILGDDIHLQEHLERAGEMDMLSWNMDSFGNLFWLFFRLSSGLQKTLDDVYSKLNLQPYKYSAVHCRVRHPKVTDKGALLKAKGPGGGPDKVGLLWEGEARKFAMELATRAIQCLGEDEYHSAGEPLYFYADSEDLVRDLTNQTSQFASGSHSLLDFEATALAAVANYHVMSRPVTSETLHIDRQLGHPPSAYYDSFVDLLIAAQARCVAVGVGNFALFAAKLSRQPCIVQYQKEAWGDEGVKENLAKTNVLHECTISSLPNAETVT